MKLTKTSGAALAAAAAAFILAGPVAPSANAGEKAEKNVQCFGVNVCKGKSACKTANSACKGQNKCKGSGFVSVSAEVCDAIGGKTKQ